MSEGNLDDPHNTAASMEVTPKGFHHKVTDIIEKYPNQASKSMAALKLIFMAIQGVSEAANQRPRPSPTKSASRVYDRGYKADHKDLADLRTMPFLTNTEQDHGLSSPTELSHLKGTQVAFLHAISSLKELQISSQKQGTSLHTICPQLPTCVTIHQPTWPLAKSDDPATCAATYPCQRSLIITYYQLPIHCQSSPKAGLTSAMTMAF